MILRVSGKLGDKIGVSPEASRPLPDDPFLDWSGHLFRANRLQHIIVTHTTTLYSLVFLGRGITTLEAYELRVRAELHKFLTRHGHADVYATHIATDGGPARFSKAYNRSVIGSVNDMVYHATYMIEQYGLSFWEVESRLNEMPMGMLDMNSAETAFARLCNEA
jgi:hypothetical protein